MAPLHPTNERLAAPYLLPYLLYVGIAAIPAAWLGRAPNYTLRLLVVGGALVWLRRRYRPLRGPRSPAVSVAVGIAAGLLGTVLWVLLVRPFAPAAGAVWTTAEWALRAAAAVLIVPLFEERTMRGYALGLAYQWEQERRAKTEDPFGAAWEKRSLFELSPGTWSVFALAVATILFALGHQTHEMPAAVVYGLLMGALWVVRRDLLSCVVAHATTNLALALYVRSAGAWELW